MGAVGYLCVAITRPKTPWLGDNRACEVHPEGLFLFSKLSIKLLMRKLIALCAFLLSASAAMAQTDKNPVVTKLPGEEKLSVRERAERDFLMPVRRKKVVEAPRAMASADMESTASPELDATAHYTEAAEARPEEITSSTRTERHTTVRHRSRAARLAAARRARAAEEHHSVRHSSKSSKAKAAKHTKATKASKHHAKAEKATSHRSHKKEVAHKTKTKTKKTTASKHHEEAKKKVSKTKTKSGKKHRH
jgi:hypothetical protein